MRGRQEAGMKILVVVGVALGTLAAAALFGRAPDLADDARAVARPMVLAAAGDPVATATVNTGTVTFSFPVRSFSAGMTSPGDPAAGGGASGPPVINGFTVVKAFDPDTVRLQRLLLLGLHLESVTVTLETGGSYRMLDVLVTSLTSSGAGTATPTDRVTFKFDRIRTVRGTVAFCYVRSLQSAC
jgi:hypothetical protein